MLGSWILAVFGVCLIFFLIRIPKPKNFPPGPQPIPVFGNLFQLNINNPLKDFERVLWHIVLSQITYLCSNLYSLKFLFLPIAVQFAKHYGNIYSLYFGRRPVVVLNGLKAIKEALVTKSADFSGRPENLLISHVTEKKGKVHLNNYSFNGQDLIQDSDGLEDVYSSNLFITAALIVLPAVNQFTDTCLY